MQDKRVHRRAIIEVEVTCDIGDGRSLPGVARDVSIGGMHIECAEVLPFGTQLTVVGTLPGMKGEARLPGTVRWCKPDGFGVQFGLLGARETHAIAQLIRKVP